MNNPKENPKNEFSNEIVFYLLKKFLDCCTQDNHKV